MANMDPKNRPAVTPSVSPRRYHVGRRSTAFDIIEGPMLVVEHIDGIAPGSVEVMRPDGPATIEPDMVKGKPSACHRAFHVQHGARYRIRGIEHRPVAVEKFVQFDEQLGFVEITEPVFDQRPAVAAKPSEDLPAIEGTIAQVEWAQSVRTKMIEEVRRRDRLDLMASFRRRKFAKFYIDLAHAGPDRWIAELELVLQSNPTRKT